MQMEHASLYLLTKQSQYLKERKKEKREKKEIKKINHLYG